MPWHPALTVAGQGAIRVCVEGVDRVRDLRLQVGGRFEGGGRSGRALVAQWLAAGSGGGEGNTSASPAMLLPHIVASNNAGTRFARPWGRLAAPQGCPSGKRSGRTCGAPRRSAKACCLNTDKGAAAHRDGIGGRHGGCALARVQAALCTRLGRLQVCLNGLHRSEGRWVMRGCAGGARSLCGSPWGHRQRGRGCLGPRHISFGWTLATPPARQ